MRLRARYKQKALVQIPGASYPNIEQMGECDLFLDSCAGYYRVTLPFLWNRRFSFFPCNARREVYILDCDTPKIVERHASGFAEWSFAGEIWWDSQDVFHFELHYRKLEKEEDSSEIVDIKVWAESLPRSSDRRLTGLVSSS